MSRSLRAPILPAALRRAGTALLLAAALFATSGCGGNEDPFARGEAALKSGDTREAIRQFQLAVDAAPRGYPPRVRLADGYRLRRQYDLAIDHYEKAAALDPTQVHPPLSIALCRYEQAKALAEARQHTEARGVFDAAIAAAKSLTQRFPDQARGFELMAQIHTSRFSNVYQSMRTLLVEFYSDREVDLMLRRVFEVIYEPGWATGERDRLRAEFTREYPFRDLDPFLQMLEDLRAGYEEVRANLETALRIEPQLTSAARDLARILANIGSFEPARERAIALRDTNLAPVADRLDKKD